MKTPNYQLGLHATIGRKSINEIYKTHFQDMIEGQHYIIHKNDELPMKSSNRFYSAINESTSFIMAPQLKAMDMDLYSTSLQE